MPPRSTFGVPVATADAPGTMPAAAYRAYAGEPPTDAAATPSTTGATGVYTTANIDVTATLGTASLRARYCWDQGRAAAGPLKLLLLWGGYRQPGTQFIDAQLQRYASWGFLAVALTPRGISPSTGDVTYCEAPQDAYDVAEAVAAIAELAGVTGLDGGATVCHYGVSTGATHVLLCLARLPHRFAGGVVFAPNWDLAAYWKLSTFARSTLIGDVGDFGTGTEAERDPYEVRNGARACGAILSLPECASPLFVFGDPADAVATPLGGDPDDLVTSLSPTHVAASKVHAYTTGYLHADAPNSGTALTAETYWAPVLLATTAWSMPRIYRGLTILGWLNTGNEEIWLGPLASPRGAATGGKSHVALVDGHGIEGRYTVTPITSTDGFVQVLRGAETREEPFTARSPREIGMLATPVITSPTEVGITTEWLSDTSVTGGATITAWGAAIGSGSLATAANHPADTDRGDGIHVVRFTRASTQRLVMSSLAVNPNSDMTMVMVLRDRTGTANAYYGELRDSGGRSAISWWRSGSAFRLSGLDTSGAEIFASPQQAMSVDADHFIAIVRRGNTVTLSVDDAVVASTTVTGTFTVDGSMKTIVGAQIGNDGTTIFNGSDVDYYMFAVAQTALDARQLDALRLWAMKRFLFGSPVAAKRPQEPAIWRVDPTVYTAGSFTPALHTIHLVDLSGGTVTATPPAASAANAAQSFRIVQTVAGTATLTIDPAGSAKVEGGTTLDLTGLASGALLDRTFTSLGDATFGWKSSA